jgi:lipid II:glycine glycyltransferase (peptidoglycan interpeptide bridge formation enzyme)
VSALSQLQSEEESLRSEIARLEQSLSDSRARERNAHTRLSSARSAINKDLHKRSQAASEHRTKRQVGLLEPILLSALFSAITGCALTAMHTGSA